MPDQKILEDRFEIVEKLGSGGSATTYKARDLRNENKICVVKKIEPFKEDYKSFLREDLNKDLERTRAYFEREVRALSHMDHPNIPKFISSFENTNEHDLPVFYLIQEYIEGKTLRDVLSSQKVSDKTRNGNQGEGINQIIVIQLLLDITDILIYIHTAEPERKIIIHRDINPNNIILREKDNEFVLIDFGFVKEIPLSSSSQEVTSRVGTPGYMAPEQLEGHSEPGTASDIYSLGITAIEALTGRRPSSGEKNIFDNTFVINELSNILNKMICRKLEDRYRTAKDLMNDLKPLEVKIEPLQEIGKIILNRYKLIAYLGGGSSRSTYIVIDQKASDERCVLKRLKPNDNNDSQQVKELRKQWKKEVSVLKKLSSIPGIPCYIDRFEENGVFYLVQQFIDGEDLNKRLKRQEKLNEDEVKKLLKDILTVLEAIHKQKTIHCDIKPSNIIYCNLNKNFFLIDFGSVKEVGETFNSSQSSTHSTQQIGGTISYMPAEQSKGKPAMESSDIYALGITTIESLTGTYEFSDDNNGELNWQSIITLEDQKLTKVLNEMVRYDYRERYQSASHVLRDLEQPLALPFLQNFLSFFNFERLRFSQSSINLVLLAFAGLTVALIVLIPSLKNDGEAKKLYEQGLIDLEEINKLVREGKNPEAIYKRALSNFQRAFELNPKMSEALVNKGYLLWQLNQYKDSLDTCKIALNSNNDKELSSLALNCIGLAQQALNQDDEAVKSFEQALELRPTFAQAWDNRGKLHLKMKQPAKALEDFNKLIALLEIELLKINSESRENNSNEDIYEKRGKINSQKAVAWNSKGTALRFLGEYQEAVVAFKESLEIDNNNYAALLGLGSVYDILNQPKEALEAYRQATRANPKGFEGWYRLGMLQEKLKDFANASFSYKEAKKINPNHQEMNKAIERLEAQRQRSPQ